MKKQWTKEKDVEVGRLVADLVYRPAIRMDFYKEMERPSQGTCDLAFEVFDG